MSTFARALTKVNAPQTPTQYLGGDLFDDELISDILREGTQASDPTSKWLLLALIVSVFLNGYFMRVIHFVTAGTSKASVGPSTSTLSRFNRTHRKTGSMPCPPSPIQFREGRHPVMHIDIPLSKRVFPGRLSSSPLASATFPRRMSVDVLSSDVSPAMTLVATPTLSGSITEEKVLVRTLGKALEALAQSDVARMNDEDVIQLCRDGKMPTHSLEKVLRDHSRAVKIRRAVLCEYCRSFPISQ